MSREQPDISLADGARSEIVTFPRPSPINVAEIDRVLFVMGPGGESRHLLPRSGLLRIGRDPGSDIPIDDLRVSRAHALVDVADQISLSDLGSANGTFVGKSRLRVGDSRVIEVGETFSIGDSVLVVRFKPNPPTGLLDVPIGDLRRYLTSSWSPGTAAGTSHEGMLVLRIRAARAESRPFLEGILAEFLVTTGDWMTRVDEVSVAVGLNSSVREAAVLERSVRSQLRAWKTDCNCQVTFVPARRLEDSLTSILSFVEGAEPPLSAATAVVRDPAMAGLRRTATRVAPTDVSVLLLGETGVGKDVVASLIHTSSRRSTKPMIRLNCASLPDNLLESELFGYEKGAFTGAVGAKMGLLETAAGGTVFLDEIGDLPFSLQAKLLRAIESREISRLGSLRSQRIDVRFVSATNRDLSDDVMSGRFRRDLFYRINCVPLEVPPLRNRPTEIVPLADHFLRRACQKFERSDLALSVDATSALLAYRWPGNVRELCNVIERAVLLADGPLISAADLVLERDRTRDGESSRDDDVPDEARSIADALTLCGGNQTRAAEVLGMSRRTLVRRLSELRLTRPRQARR